MMSGTGPKNPPPALSRLRVALTRFVDDRRGAVVVLAAIVLTVCLLLTAFAVDVASLYLERRRMQSLTDLAAITVATRMVAPESAAARFMAENGYAGLTVSRQVGAGADLVLQTGNYRPDPEIPVEERFRPDTTPLNAARVTFSRPGRLYFSRSFMDEPMITTTGLAHASAEAAFSVGSRLLRVDGGIVNSLLGGLLGANLSLSVMDYEALLDTRISLFKFFDALASDLDMEVGTYDDLADAEVSLARIAALAAAIARSENARAANAMATLSGSGNAETLTVPLNRLVDLGQAGRLAIGTGDAVLRADIGLMELVGVGAAVADGSNQVRLSVSSGLPGITGLTVDLAIGEPPRSGAWFAIGGKGTVVRTAQTRLYVRASVGGSGLLSGVSLTLPVYLELAYAEARLADIGCAGGQLPGLSIDIEARPGVASLWIAEVDPAKIRDFGVSPSKQQARLLATPILKAKAYANADIGNTDFTMLRFSHADIANGTVRTVSTGNISAPLVATLLGDLDVDVDILGLVLISPDALASLVSQTLKPAATAIDTVLYNLLSTLGVRLGEADIRVHGARCQRAVLVQ